MKLIATSKELPYLGFFSEYTNEVLFTFPSPRRGFIMTIRGICSMQILLAMSCTPLRRLYYLRKHLAKVYATSVLQKPTSSIFYVQFISCNLPDHFIRSTLRNLAENVWPDPMDKQAANEIVSLVIFSGRENRFSRSEPVTKRLHTTLQYV